MSEQEFPPGLIERCTTFALRNTAVEPAAAFDIACDVLRESGHADLVKTLQEARAFIERGYGDEDAQIERIDAALRKAGEL